MLVAKQVADLITFARGMLAFWLVWLGFTQGDQALVLVVWIMILDWMGDSIDGPIARRSSVYYHTWIGDHDLEVDITVSAGLLIYLLSSGFLQWQWVVIYLLVWAVVFWRWGFYRSLGMLIQAPIYAWFIYIAVREPPHAGWWMVGWIAALVIITWPKFPREVIPGFLGGIVAINDDERTFSNSKKK
jgi:cardiolipin synthase (CMP-forming)